MAPTMAPTAMVPRMTPTVVPSPSRRSMTKTTNRTMNAPWASCETPWIASTAGSGGLVRMAPSPARTPWGTSEVAGLGPVSAATKAIATATAR